MGIIFVFLAILTAGEGLAGPIGPWQAGYPFTQGHPFRIYYADGLFLAVGEFGAIYTSGDGVDWTWRNSGTNYPLYDVVYGGGVFVAVGAAGTVLTSSDGIAWISQSSAISGLISGLTFGRDIFVAVGDQGQVLTSSNGAVWTIRNSGTQQGLRKVVFGKNTFVVVGTGGAILTSPDGVTWTVAGSGTNQELEGIAYGNNTFVAIGKTILISSNGVSWTESPMETNHFFADVAYGNGTFVAVADNGIILTSTDGSAWTERSSETLSALWTVAYGKNNFLAAGEGGILLQSEPIPNAEILTFPTSLDFGSVRVGNSSSIILTIRNWGSTIVSILELIISGPSATDFNIWSEDCTGPALRPNEDCTVQIVFSPHTLGFKSATLSIFSDDPDTPTQTVSLSGNGSGFLSGTNESYCFISFSALGSELEQYIGVLRAFRDTFLMESKMGRSMVNLYYQLSPSLVQFIAKHDYLKEIVRIGLVPLVAIFYLVLNISPTEKALFYVLLTGILTARWLKIRRSIR